LREPRALELDAVLLDQGAERAILELHCQSFTQIMTSTY
jgi:hypothetical protein